MSKDEVKIFTGSGTFKLPENKTETKKKTDEVMNIVVPLRLW